MKHISVLPLIILTIASWLMGHPEQLLAHSWPAFLLRTETKREWNHIEGRELSNQDTLPNKNNNDYRTKQDNFRSFLEKYKQGIKYHWFAEDHYSIQVLDSIQHLTVDYVANANNLLLQSLLDQNKEIEYSIENTQRNNRSYYLIGIGATEEHYFTVVQWIYIDGETKKIYEYDLPNDQLLPFP